jgi:hypothetical protein
MGQFRRAFIFGTQGGPGPARDGDPSCRVRGGRDKLTARCVPTAFGLGATYGGGVRAGAVASLLPLPPTDRTRAFFAGRCLSAVPVGGGALSDPPVRHAPVWLFDPLRSAKYSTSIYLLAVVPVASNAPSLSVRNI